jgi:hypothetical protein
MLCLVSTLEVPVACFALLLPVLRRSLVSCALCSVLPTPLPEMSRIKFANEISRIPGVRVTDRPRFPSPSAVLGPVYASAPSKILTPYLYAIGGIFSMVLITVAFAGALLLFMSVLR